MFDRVVRLDRNPSDPCRSCVADAAHPQDGKQMALQLEGVEKGLTPRLQGLQGSVAALAEHVYGCQELADKVCGHMVPPA